MLLSKYLALSTVICCRTPEWQIMFCQKNFCIVAKDMLVIGFALTHLVKYYTTTMVKV
jgi:hypothetical protein